MSAEEWNEIHQLISLYRSKQEWISHARATFNLGPRERTPQSLVNPGHDELEGLSDSDASGEEDQEHPTIPITNSIYPQSNFRTSAHPIAQPHESRLKLPRRLETPMEQGPQTHSRNSEPILSLYASLVQSRMESCQRMARIIQREDEARRQSRQSASSSRPQSSNRD